MVCTAIQAIKRLAFKFIREREVKIILSKKVWLVSAIKRKLMKQMSRLGPSYDVRMAKTQKFSLNCIELVRNKYRDNAA